MNDAEFEHYLLEMMRSVGAILVGRVTYEMFSEFWPKVGTEQAEAPPGEAFASPEGEQELGALMNSIPKIVFSRTLKEAPWGPSSIVAGDVAERVAEWKRQPGKDLFLFAGATLAQTFMRLDLIDEYRLLFHPILLGRGKPLFHGLDAERELVRTDVKAFRSGVVAVHYDRRRAG